MSDFTSSDDLFMGVTPGGSFYAVQSDDDDFGGKRKNDHKPKNDDYDIV